jgi:hypothetical protein
MSECPREDAVIKKQFLDPDMLNRCIESHVKEGDFIRTGGCKGCPKYPFKEKKENDNEWPGG